MSESGLQRKKFRWVTEFYSQKTAEWFCWKENRIQPTAVEGQWSSTLQTKSLCMLSLNFWIKHFNQIVLTHNYNNNMYILRYWITRTVWHEVKLLYLKFNAKPRVLKHAFLYKIGKKLKNFIFRLTRMVRYCDVTLHIFGQYFHVTLICDLCRRLYNSEFLLDSRFIPTLSLGRVGVVETEKPTMCTVAASQHVITTHTSKKKIGRT